MYDVTSLSIFGHQAQTIVRKFLLLQPLYDRYEYEPDAVITWGSGLVRITEYMIQLIIAYSEWLSVVIGC